MEDKLTLNELLHLLDINEIDAMKAIIAWNTPPNPGVLRANWSRDRKFGNDAPKAKEFWRLMVDAEFKCQKCDSQYRLTYNHINGDASDHRLENLEVLCFSCNRALSSRGTNNFNIGIRIVQAAISLWRENREFPSVKMVCEAVGIEQIGGYNFLIKYLKFKLKNKNYCPVQPKLPF